MKAAVLFFLKMLLVYFAAYFIPFCLIHYYTDGEIRWERTIISTLILTLIFTIVYAYKHIREIKKLHHGPLSSQDFKVHQVLKLHLPLTQQQILQKLQTTFPGKEWEMQEDANVIRLKTYYSWKSFGEKVIIKVSQLQDNLSEVVLESRPKNPLTLWDFGKNQENILFLRDLLTT